MVEAMGFAPDAAIGCRDFKIGCIGAGFIMADVHLAAYTEAGFPVVAIASRTHGQGRGGRQALGHRARSTTTPEALIEDPEVEILDIAFPPDQQPALIRHALRQPHVKAILAQKPLALDLGRGRAALEANAAAAGKVLSVNQNMRFDQSMRVLKQLLDRGELGEPVIATIEMRAIPHWQDFLRDYDRLTLLNMSIHHLDVLRFLFGDPTEIFTAARPDPRTAFAHTDGITASTLQFPVGAAGDLAGGCLVGPARRGLPVRHLHQMAGGGHGRAWRRGRSAGRTTRRQPVDAALLLAPHHRRRMGRAALGHDVVPACLQGRDGAAAGCRARSAREPMLSGARQRQDDGAGRGRLPLDDGRPLGQAVRDLGY